MQFIKTLKLKVKADDYAWLNRAAREVNLVWNWANEVSQDAANTAKRGFGGTDGSGRPMRGAHVVTGIELCSLSTGGSEVLDYIGANTIQRVAMEFPRKLAQAKDAAFDALENERDPEEREKIRRRIARLMSGKLRWRASGGPKRALGWVPWKAPQITLTEAGVRFAGKHFRVFEREKLDELQQPENPRGRPWRDGCFAQDASGDWYLCLPVKTEAPQPLNLPGSVGFDIGLKDIAVDNEGWRVPAPKFYRRAERRLAELQRPRGTRRDKKRTRRSKRLARAHRKVARQRRDYTHKASAKAVKRALKRGNGKIYLGDVSSSGLAQTRMAKSVLDACWSAFRSQVLYKSQQAGIEARVVSEWGSTQECSNCHAQTGPAGQEGLKVREWTCSKCGVVHDRDQNSAQVIRSRGDHALVPEASGCNGAEPRRPGVRRQRRSAPNERRLPVSGYRASSSAS